MNDRIASNRGTADMISSSDTMGYIKSKSRITSQASGEGCVVPVASRDPLVVSLEDTVTANDIILSPQDVAFNGDGLHHKYFIYSVLFDARMVELCAVMGLLTAPFSRKAKLTLYDSHMKLNHTVRFLPVVELFCPEEQGRPKRAAPTPAAENTGDFRRELRSFGTASFGSHSGLLSDPLDTQRFSFRVAVGDGHYDLEESIRENRRLTDKGSLKWIIQLLDTLLFAHRQYITLGDWTAADVRILSDDSILEAYQEVRRKLYRQDGIVGAARLSPTQPHSRSPDGRTMTVAEVEDDKERARYQRSIVKGRVSRDAWLSFHRQLEAASGTTRNTVLPDRYAVLREFDPGCTGMSRVAHNEGAYAEWRRQRDRYIAGMQNDYRRLGLVICQLVHRRVYTAIEVNQFMKKNYEKAMAAEEAALERYPLALRDLLRSCFAVSPYEVVGLMTLDDTSSNASSSVGALSQETFLSAEKLFFRDINMPHQLKIMEQLCRALKRDWSVLDGQQWGQSLDIKQLMLEKAKVEGWTEEKEQQRLKDAVERQKRNDQRVEKGRHDAAARVTAHVTRVMFDMKSPREQRRLIERELRRKEGAERARRRAQFIHKASFHCWPQEETAAWCSKAVLQGFQQLRSLLPLYKPKKEAHPEPGSPDSRSSGLVSTTTASVAGSTRFPPIHSPPAPIDWSVEPSREEGPKRDVAEKRLVLETLSSFSKISKRVEVMVKQKGSVDITDDVAFKKGKDKRSKKKPQVEVQVEVAGDATDSGGSDEDEFESGTAEVNSDGEETVKSSIAGSSVASTRRTANDDYSLSDGTQTTAVSSVARLPAQRMTKIRRLLGLVEHRVKKPNTALERLKKNKKAGVNDAAKSADDASHKKQPAWAQPFQRKLTPEEIEAKHNANYLFLGAVIGKYLSTRSPPPQHLKRTAAHQLSIYLAHYIKNATTQMMNNDIVKWLPAKEIAVKVKFTATDNLVVKWTELRECLTALAKRCDMLEGIYDWVSSISRGIITSFIDLYLRERPDRERGEGYAQHRLVAFFRMIVTRAKYRRIWQEAETRAFNIIQKEQEVKQVEQDKKDKIKKRKEAAISDAMGRAKLLQSSMSSEIDLSNLAEGLLMEADGDTCEDAPWTFGRQIVPTTNPAKRRMGSSDGSVNGTGRTLSRGSRQTRRNPHPKSTELETLEVELLALFTEICPPHTVMLSTDDCLEADNRSEKEDKRRVAAAAQMFSEISAAEESPEDKEWLEQDTMAGVYIEAIRGSAEEENRGVGSGIRTAAAASRDSLHDRLVDVLDNATAIRGEEWALEASAQGPDEETTSVSVLLGLDLTSSSWGLPEHISQLGALVYVDLSAATEATIRNPPRSVQNNSFSRSELVVVVDEKDRLKYATSAEVTAAIKTNTHKIAGTARRSLAIVSSTMGEQTEPLLPNLVCLQDHGVIPTIAWREVPYNTGQLFPPIDKSQQNKMLSRLNAELQSFEDPDEAQTSDLTGPERIRQVREASRQGKRQGTAVLSKRQLDQMEYDATVRATLEDLQESYAGWSCMTLDVPGLVPGMEYTVRVVIGKHLKPQAKYRGLGVRLPSTASPDPGYARIYVTKGLKLPHCYQRCSLVATGLAEARQAELDKVNLHAVDIHTVEREPLMLAKDVNTGVVKAPNAVPNRPKRVKTEIRRGTAMDRPLTATQTGNSALGSLVRSDEATSSPLAVNVRVVWTPAVCNGEPVISYTVRRRLAIYLCPYLTLHELTASQPLSQNGHLLRINRGEWLTLVSNIPAMHPSNTSAERVVPNFPLSKYTDKTSYYHHLATANTTDTVQCHADKTCEVENEFLSPGCAYTDTVDELQILLNSLTEKDVLLRLKDAFATTGSSGISECRAFLVAEYSVCGVNAIGPSNWSQTTTGFITEHGKAISFLYRLNRERKINRGEWEESAEEFDAVILGDKKPPEEARSTEDMEDLIKKPEELVTIVGSKVKKPRTKKKGVSYGVYNHASSVLLQGVPVMPSTTDHTGTRLALPIVSATADENEAQQRDVEVEASNSNISAADPSASSQVPASPGNAKPKTGLSFLSRLAEASPLTHSQPLDDDELATFMPTVQKGKTMALKNNSNSPAEKVSGSELLDRYQSFAATKDISVASESTMRRYQQKF